MKASLLRDIYNIVLPGVPASAPDGCKSLASLHHSASGGVAGLAYGYGAHGAKGGGGGDEVTSAHHTIPPPPAGSGAGTGEDEAKDIVPTASPGPGPGPGPGLGPGVRGRDTTHVRPPTGSSGAASASAAIAAAAAAAQSSKADCPPLLGGFYVLYDEVRERDRERERGAGAGSGGDRCYPGGATTASGEFLVTR